jgi:hypothetical protein
MLQTTLKDDGMTAVYAGTLLMDMEAANVFIHGRLERKMHVERRGKGNLTCARPRLYRCFG